MSESYTVFTADQVLTYLNEKNGFVPSIPIDVEHIAALLGIEIVNDYSLGRDVVGKIEFVNRRPVITINPAQNLYPPRRRFTIAHEIGHYILHTSRTGQAFVDSQTSMNRVQSYWDITESEANHFAACLLMPEGFILQEGHRVIDEFRRREGENSNMPDGLFVERMATRFAVSIEAMDYRLQRLGILAPEENMLPQRAA